MVSGEGVQANRVTVAIRDHSFLSKKPADKCRTHNYQVIIAKFGRFSNPSGKQMAGQPQKLSGLTGFRIQFWPGFALAVIHSCSSQTCSYRCWKLHFRLVGVMTALRSTKSPPLCRAVRTSLRRGRVICMTIIS